MSKYKYKNLVKVAEEIKANVEKEQRTIRSYKWTYYFCKAIIDPKKDITKIKIDKAPKPSKTNISRQMTESQYKALAKKMIVFVEKNHKLPNYLRWGKYKISQRLYTYTFARILVYYDKYGKFDKEITINEKIFTKATETGNKVYDYFVKKTGKKFTHIDDILLYIRSNWHYEYYFDDKKSNKQVIDTKGGNCVDMTQFLTNMAEAMGYDWKTIHVKCKQSGDGHVFNKFKKKGTSTWFARDISSVADGGAVDSIWCANGTVLATNPQWWMENRNR